MPPPPPPGPPPPPAPPPMKAGKSVGKKTGGGGTDRNALLQSIQQGKALKKTVTNDRSTPQVGGIKTSNKTQNNSSGGPSGGFRQNGGSNEPNGETPRLPGIGGLFAGGMPTLKPAGSRGIQTGRATGKFRKYTWSQ